MKKAYTKDGKFYCSKDIEISEESYNKFVDLESAIEDINKDLHAKHAQYIKSHIEASRTLAELDKQISKLQKESKELIDKAEKSSEYITDDDRYIAVSKIKEESETEINNLKEQVETTKSNLKDSEDTFEREKESLTNERDELHTQLIQLHVDVSC